MRIRFCALIFLAMLLPAASAFAQATKTVAGRVIDAETGQPVAGAVITVVGTDLTATTDAAGDFSLPGVAAGDVTLQVNADTFAPVEVVLPAAQLRLDARMVAAAPPTRLITGYVQTDAGEPVANAVVVVPGTPLQTNTDERGFFVFTDAPAQDLTLQISAPNTIASQSFVPAGQSSVRVLLAPSTPAPPPVVEAPAARTVTGRVIESTSGVPIPGAVVAVQQTGQSVFTDPEGNFVIENAPDGPLTLQVSTITHEDRTINLAADATTATVEMQIIEGETIIMSGRAPELVRQNRANGASVVEGDALNRVPAATLDDALQGKVAGANIQRNSGAPGGGIQLQLRGISTINGSSSPLYVIDGVIISNSSIPSGLSALTASTGNVTGSDQDNAVNRTADINPNDIANIEILKGPAAAALYGSKAANGVVIITTKRGIRGEFRASVTQRIGFSQILNKLGSRDFETVEEAIDTFGPDAAQYYEEGRTFDHEEQLFGENNLATETVVQVSGGGKDNTYFGSFLVRDEPGILINSGYQKQSGRIGLTQQLGERVTVGGSANLIHTDTARGITNNDNTGISHYFALSSTPKFFDLRRVDDAYPENPFVPSGTNPLQTANIVDVAEEVWRMLGAANADVVLLEEGAHQLRASGNAGLDWFQQQNNLYAPPEAFFEDDDGLPGTTIDANAESLNVNGVASLIYGFTPVNGAWQSLSTLGFIYEQRQSDRLYAIGRNLPRDQRNVDAATAVEPNQFRSLVKDRGGFLQQEFTFLDNALSVKLGLLAESSSVNGDTDELFLFPKAAAVYTLPSFGEEAVVEQIRLRGAYGEVGNQPLYGQKFTPLNAAINYSGEGGLRINGTAGDAEIEPERQREFEGGVDFKGWDGRILAEATLYQKTVENLILERTPATSTGFGLEYLNGGELRNRGVELLLQVEPVRNDVFNWTSRTIFTLNRSQIDNLPVPAFDAGGFAVSLGVFRIEEGKSATQIIGRRPDEDAPGGFVVGQVGDGAPDFQMSFLNSFDIGDFGFTTLFDWQQGGDVINLTKFLYDLAGNTADFDEPIEGSDLTVGQRRLQDSGTNTRVYLEDASFVKLRELKLYYALPDSIVKLVGPMNSARIEFSGRNLLVFTNYSGLDPEVSNFGNQPVARNIDVGPFPPVRSYWLSVNAEF